MNFYTSTFKKKVIISLLLVLGALIVLDLGLYFMIEKKSSKTTYINSKFSKLIHFKLNATKPKDIIFMGSSKTFYHISTNLFKENGFDIYNLGISGTFMKDFPSLIPQINANAPKEVIISSSIEEPYQTLHVAEYPTKEEISYYYEIDKVKFLESIQKWIINRHVFLEASEPIFNKIGSFYDKFSPKNQSKKQETKERHGEAYFSKIAGCNVFNIKEYKKEITLKCSNGDGVLIGHYEGDEKKERKELKKLNPQTVKYLHKLIDSIDKKTKVTLVFEPRQGLDYIYNITDIEKEFEGIDIIDLTQLNLDEFALDKTHLNYKGREAYSKYLIKRLKNRKK